MGTMLTAKILLIICNNYETVRNIH